MRRIRRVLAHAPSTATSASTSTQQRRVMHSSVTGAHRSRRSSRRRIGSDRSASFVCIGTQRMASFFFSSRRRHTRCSRDWSSDVCSSDLILRLDPLAWGVENGRKMAAPAIEIDHLRNGFDGGRWVFLTSELPSQFAASNEAVALIRTLAERARHGSEEFTARPALPLYLPGEPVEVEGQPIAVVGTTYMSSEVQRLYFDHPNVYVWDRDMAQIEAAGLNMLRTGWWTGWDKFCDENGQPYERTLRTLEAYLMTARKHGFPVQFNFFAFLPDVLGGVNPYWGPEARRKQQTLVTTVVGRFRDVPFLAWDLINEPSISEHLWQTRPNGDPIELAAWNEWLSKRYPDRAGLAAAWNVPLDSLSGTVS